MNTNFLPPRIVALAVLPVAIAVGRAFLNELTQVPDCTAPTGIIDTHCHAAGIGAGGSGCFVSDHLSRSARFRAYLRGFGITREELERCGDGVVIDRLSERVAASRHVGRAVVLALDGTMDRDGNLDRARTEMYVPNEFVAAEVAKHPNLLFGASVNPYRRDALVRLEWAKAHGAVLVKWLPSIQHIDPADPHLIPFYQKLVELDLPLLTHTGAEHAFGSVDDRLGDPARLALPLHEGVRVIAAHAATSGRYGGEASLDRLVRLMHRYPNLYADVSSLTQINKHNDLRTVLAHPEFRDRLIYGSDYPLVEMPALVSPWYYAFQLPVGQVRGIAAPADAWDRDVALKQALGLPEDAWTRAEKVLSLPHEPAERVDFLATTAL